MNKTSETSDPGFWIILSLAIACGVNVANIYYAQPLIGPISEDFHLDIAASGLIVTMIQIGYVLGLIFLAPLGDLLENKRLILTALGAVVASLLISSIAPNASVFIAASLILGVTATATQMILPVAAHLAPEHKRGQIVGTVMSGLLFGILLARPVSTLVAGLIGWRGVYAASAIAMLVVVAMLSFTLPRRQPDHMLTYGKLLSSMWSLLRDTPELQRRTAYQGMMYGAFSLFWTAAPLILLQPPFSLSHIALSLFLLSGAAGAFVAPVAGRLADKGHGDALTIAAIVMVAIGFVLVWVSGSSLTLWVLAGIILDAGVQMNMLAGQRAIYSLDAEIRSRVNALYIALFFLGGAIGSALSGWAVSHGGHANVAMIGLCFPAITLILFLGELFRRKRA
ncbi:MFS transporter [[Pseudomonas] carboxydohydrogena]|uniref:MFS transporter n=1 Tax=Afipia carboxydohydrogena TaxID=290 RepID=A0ABY8BQX3_AFICR|nr:MFS transporter [[Pseudomonas] carboxydohydrogena]WEF52400.1 MFS transporter [[Pseudomonas] carboxydohydrogena]